MERTAARAALVIGSLQLLWFVHAYAVNIFYFDAWSIYPRFFENLSAWELFLSRAGSAPHRPGLGLLLAKACLELSNWNARTESFAIALLLIASAALVFRLKNRLGIRASYWDVLLVAYLLSLASWETLVGTPISAFGAVPYFLFIVLAQFLVIDHIRWRSVGLAAVASILIFCTYGYLALPPVLFLLARDALREPGARRKGWPVGSIMVLLAAFSYYVLSAPPGPGDGKSIALVHYLEFLGTLTATAFGWYMYLPPLTWIGLGLFLGLLALAGWSALDAVFAPRSARTDLLLLMLSWSLLFILLSSYGRSDLGARGALTSRYFVYLLPLVIAVYFWGSGLKNPLGRQGLLASLAISQVALTLFLWLHQLPKVRAEMDKREQIVRCLRLPENSVAHCQSEAGYLIHPDLIDGHVQQTVDLLRARHLGPFDR